MPNPAYYDFFRRIVLSPDGVTLEADSVTDTVTITRGTGVAFNPNETNDSFEIDVDYQFYVPVGTTDLRLDDVNSNVQTISINPGPNISIQRNSDNELTITSTVGGASKAITNATTTNPVVITTGTTHSFTEGRPVTMTDVGGMTQLNGNEYYMDILTGTTFALYEDDALSVPLDGTGFTTYTTGGVATAEYFPRTQLDELSDVNTSGVLTNDILAFDGIEFVPTNTLIGELKGSVFGDDSTVLVDSVNSNIPTSVLSGTLTNNISTSSLRTSELSIRLGNTAASISPGTYSIAVGDGAGENTQGNYSIAIGKNSGQLGQLGAVAIGFNAGQAYQKNLSVAVGDAAGQSYQDFYATAIGSHSGNNAQSTLATALGHYAGNDTQGESAIAIGAFAGLTNQAANSIIINATGVALQNTTADSFVVKPIRNNTESNILGYNNTSGEITYQAIPTGNFTFSSSNIDTDDSSPITITPGVVMQSDLTIQNDIIFNNAIEIPDLSTLGTTRVLGNQLFNQNVRSIYGPDNNLQIFNNGTASIIADNRGDPLTLSTENIRIQTSSGYMIYGDTNSVYLYGGGSTKLVTSATGVNLPGQLYVTGSTVFQGSTSEVVQSTLSGTNITLNLNGGSVGYIASPTGDILLNVTNVPTTDDRTLSISVIVNQGTTPYEITNIYIDSLLQTIEWVDGIVPLGTASGTDVFSFTLVRTGSAWLVLGSATGFE